MSSKDANLTDNLKIRNMIYDFKNGKLETETVVESQDTIFFTEQDIISEIEAVNEVEIQPLTPENNFSAFDKQFTNPLEITEVIQTEEISTNESTNEPTVYVTEQPLPLESITFNSGEILTF